MNEVSHEEKYEALCNFLLKRISLRNLLPVQDVLILRAKIASDPILNNIPLSSWDSGALCIPHHYATVTEEEIPMNVRGTCGLHVTKDGILCLSLAEKVCALKHYARKLAAE